MRSLCLARVTVSGAGSLGQPSKNTLLKLILLIPKALCQDHISLVLQVGSFYFSALGPKNISCFKVRKAVSFQKDQFCMKVQCLVPYRNILGLQQKMKAEMLHILFLVPRLLKFVSAMIGFIITSL